MGQNKRISMVCYADDAAIFAETEDDLERHHTQFLAVHLPGTDPEKPAKLTDHEILNMKPFGSVN